ncbi:MAG: NAD-dependent epimerase/dehydratase family protein [Hymenobacter sp.]
MRRTYGLEIIGLRYFNIFGPRQDPGGAYAAVIPLFIDAILQNQAAHAQRRRRPDPRLHLRGELRAGQHPRRARRTNPEAVNQVYNIAVGDRTSLVEMYDILREEAGSDLAPEFGPDRAGDIRDSLADISKAGTLLGYAAAGVASAKACARRWTGSRPTRSLFAERN